MTVGFSIAMPQKRSAYQGSVLPDIPVRRSGRSVILAFGGDSEGTVLRAAAGSLAVMAWGAFVLWQWRAEGCGLWFAVACVVPPVIGGYAHYIRSSWRATFFGEAQLTVDHWPLRLGEEVTVRFRRRLRRDIDMTVDAAVECSEEVEIGDSETSSTKSQRRFAIPLDTSALRLTPHWAQAEWTFTLPPDRPPSFAVRYNAIVWRVSVTFQAPEWRANAPAIFPLLVLPETVT